MSRNRWLFAAIPAAALGGLLALWLGQTPAAGPREPARTWEYRWVGEGTLRAGKGDDLVPTEEGLNRMGEAGWDLVQVIPRANGRQETYVFKRPK